jgi:hypothetical protein
MHIILKLYLNLKSDIFFRHFLFTNVTIIIRQKEYFLKSYENFFILLINLITINLSFFNCYKN